MADPEIDGTRQHNFAVLDFKRKMAIIGGTGYTGEIKKGIFTVLNYVLPQDKNVLSMHCSANVGKDGDTAVFFGLSGTGKTTLSSDPNRRLIGDDEQPVGGQWNFDDQNRKPYSKNGPGLIDDPLIFVPDEISREILEFVARQYPEHPGSLEHFSWPVTREQALAALKHFVNHRLATFGIYQDAMWKETPFGWHAQQPRKR
jgi:hypothetical protein